MSEHKYLMGQTLMPTLADASSLLNKPHHADIARHLMQGIASGRFAVGSLLPTEHALCEQYQTSRHTIRVALAELQQLGLVSRRKNVGTRVEASRPKNNFRSSLESVDDLVQFGARHMRVVQSIEEVAASSALAQELGCAPGARWLRISSLRMQGKPAAAPIGWTDVYVDPAYADIAELVRATPDVLISSLIETRYGRYIAEIEQDIRAATVTDPAMAETLQLDLGQAVLKIVRRYRDACGEAFEISVTVHPAERFSVSMRLQRSET